MHRLEEMKAWQKEQQSKLLKTQQQQEDNFLKAQKQQILNYLSQNEQNFSDKDDDRSSVDSKMMDNSQAASEVLSFNPAISYDTEESRKSRIKYLEALLDECYHKKALLEEMPISTSYQDFEQLLEMNLSQNKENIPNEEDPEVEFERIQEKPKRPFLRKGEGLARFNMTPEDFKRPVEMNFYRSRSHSKLKTNPSSVSRSSTSRTPVRSRQIAPPRSKLTLTKSSSKPPATSVKPSRSAPSVSIVQNARKPNLPPSILKKPLHSQVSGSRNPSALSQDAEQKKKKEQRELRVFEILEEKVGESSFCSTSSTIAKLMEDSVKSTPLKDKNDAGPPNARTETLQPDSQKVTGEQRLHSNKVQGNDDTDVEDDDGWTDISSDEESGGKERTGFTSDDSERLCSPPPNFQKHARFDDDAIYQKMSAPCLTTQRDAPVFPRSSASLPDTYAATQKDNTAHHKTSVPYAITQKDFEDLGLKFQPENFIPGFAKTSGPSLERQNSVGNKADAGDFKNELLQQRLEDLEKEVEIFRKENAKLARQKQELESERVAFLKQRREFDARVKKFHEEEELQLAEERKKLQKERLVFEKYTKEVRSKPNKQEREEIKHLKDEVSELKKELERREAKWGSTLARLRNQMKVMEKDKDDLREEIISLQKESTQKQLISKGLKLTDNMTNTKIIHAINRQLSQLTPEDIEELLSKREQILKKPQIINKPQNVPKNSKPAVRKPALKKSTEPTKNQKKVQINIRNPASDTSESEDSDIIVDAVRKPVLKAVYPEDVVMKQYEDEFFTAKAPVSSRLSAESELKGDVIECVSIDGNREKIFPDGRKEIWFPNGNVKKISPDGNTIKIIYYNGDVKETVVSDNVVKYYYAESKTWHTTYGDGLEILEFSNGQVEKRLTNGVVEISFPNGCGRKIFPDGQEEWTFSDKSVLKTDKKTGYRMLELPNGQKEIHTAEYKKREFPDGTVKLVYPDGTQETRYANGRIRLKDKNGKLIMDSDIK